MLNATIENIVSKLKSNKKNGGPGALVFLGAGASVTAGIPLAKDIIADVLKEHGDSYEIEQLSNDDKTDYYKLMGCLDPKETKRLFKKYIESAQINISHIYLADLISQGYVDYILTVNFDNLSLRALALHNIVPATYDMVSVSGLGTSTFDHPSVVFLHGQHTGFSQLNTKPGFKDAKGKINKALQIICDRPWIVVGYSGTDFVFDYICEVESFDEKLYWVCHNDNDPSKKVKSKLLSIRKKNSFIVKGYDSDKFFITLHEGLKLKQPAFIQEPFTHLKKGLEKIILVDEKQFVLFKDTFDISKKWIDEAIEGFENKKGFPNKFSEDRIDINTDYTIKEIIKITSENNFNKILEIEDNLTDVNIDVVKHKLSEAYVFWGNKILLDIKTNKGNLNDGIQKEIFDKYSKAISLDTSNDLAFFYWGLSFYDLAQLLNLRKKRELLFESISKFNMALGINPNKELTYVYLGVALNDLAKLKKGKDAEALFEESIKKYIIAEGLNPKDEKVYYYWGITLYDFSCLKDENKETERKAKEELLLESVEKYNKAFEINPNNDLLLKYWGDALFGSAKLSSEDKAVELYKQSIDKYDRIADNNILNEISYYNWGVSLSILGKKSRRGEESEKLYSMSIGKFEKLLDINYYFTLTYNTLINTLISFSKMKDDSESKVLLDKAFNLAIREFDLNENFYDLSCVYANKNEDDNAFNFLEKALFERQQTFKWVEEDDSWNGMRHKKRYMQLKKEYYFI